MAATVTHPKCGKSWTQHGNRTGHCAKCHETFEGITAFDAHQHINEDGSVTCLDPSTVKVSKTFLVLRDGSWRGPGMPQTLRDKYDLASRTCPSCGDVVPVGWTLDDHFNCNWPEDFE